MGNKLKQTFFKQRSFLYIVILTLLFVSLTGFSLRRHIAIIVNFENIDEYSSDLLKLEFKMFYSTNIKTIAGGKIDILKNDTLYLRLVADTITGSIDLWTFPSIPDRYRIAYPELTENLPHFDKADQLKFIFSFGANFGMWEYKPFYSDKKARWLFDEFGNQKIVINSEYEPWLFGKDIITVKMNENFSIENTKFQLLDDENNPLEFELKYKKNPTNIVALKLNKKEKKGQKLKLSLNFGEEKYYEEEITVPSRSIVGIAGKYNSL